MKKLFFILASVFASGSLYAQEPQQAEPFFHDLETTTARSMGTAGAFGAVGADLSSATSNPAGVAFFRKKELGLSLGYNQNEVSTDYLNQKLSATENRLGVHSVAYVFSNVMTEYINDSLAVKKDGLVSWAVTIGMNQKSDLNEQLSYNAFNTSNSLISSYVSTANQNSNGTLGNLDDFEQQAFDTGLMQFENGRYSSALLGGNVQQNGAFVRSGTKRDFYISGGANISNELYVGATLAAPMYNYESEFKHKETDTNNSIANFNELNFNDTREYDATGGSLSLGAIYRLSDYFRVGASLKTPSAVLVSEKSTIVLENNSNAERSSNVYESEYTLILPMKAGLQMTASHPKYGLISIEGDYVDYGGTKLDYDDQLENQRKELEDNFKKGIKNTYSGKFNLRGGLEARLFQNLRLRGGAAYYQSPYKNKEDELGADYSKLVLGLGAGYRFVPANIVVDLGFNQIKTGEFATPYVINGSANPIDANKVSNQFRLGISKRFNQ